MTDNEQKYLADLQAGMRAMTEEEIAARQREQFPLMRGMDQEELAALRGDGLRNLFAASGSAGGAP